MHTSISSLKTNGFVAIPYPADLRSVVNAAVDSWKKFCELPVALKKGLPYGRFEEGVGYELKDGSGRKGDRKENFDVTLRGTEWLRAHTARATDHDVWTFVGRATALVEILKPVVLDFARQAELAFGIEGLHDEVADEDNAFFVRFLHYFGNRTVGEETAAAHVDQSGFTLHLFESAPGLQCLTYDGDWIDMPVSEGETVIIPGMQLQLRSGGRLRALCHRVVAVSETAEVGRYSAVCFVQFSRTPKYDKSAQGRLQEKAPGFNYGISHGDFPKFFR